MDAKSRRADDDQNTRGPDDEKAAAQTPAWSARLTPVRRGLRVRRGGRPRPGGAVPPASSGRDTNGAAVQSARGSGRVLRDRSTRSVPAWLKDIKSDDDDEEDEPGPTLSATKRRKVSYSRRRKPTEPPAGDDCGGGGGGASTT
ncbi:hypothetical protein NHX12_017554, partial [Muraenolepis orangiensis]